MSQLEREIVDRASKKHNALPMSMGNPNMRMSQSFEGVITSDPAATFYAAEMLKEIRILNHRVGASLGVKPGDEGGGIFTTAQGREGPPPPAHVQEPSKPPTDRRTSPAHEGDVARTGGMDENLPPAPAHLGPAEESAYQRLTTEGFSRENLRGFSIASLRQQAGASMEERLGNVTWGTQIARDRVGRWHDPITGQFVSEEDPAVQSFLKREAVVMAGRGFGKALAGGASVREAGAGALASAPGGMAALRVAGGVAVAAHVADQVVDFAVNQRAQNAQWQRIMGGTNLAGFGERIGQQAYGFFSQFGGMSSEDAEALYAGVAATGMRGDERTRAQQFAQQNYSEFGMTVEQSMEIINVAAQTGQESLLGVASALQRVTESAVEAGVNTEVARQRFVDTYTTLATTIGGQAAVTTAAGMTGALTAMGPEFQNITPQIGEPLLRRVSAAMGLPSQGALRATALEPGQEGVIMEGVAALASRDIKAMTSQSPRNGKTAEEAIAPYRGLSMNELTDVQKRELSQWGLIYGPQDMQAMISILTGLGFPADASNAPLLWAQLYLEQYQPGAAAAEAAEAGELRSIDVSTSGKFLAQPSSKEFKALQEKVSASETSHWGIGEGAVGDYFLRNVKAGGQAGGIAEIVATDAGVRQAISQVEVRGENGTLIKVPLDVAIRDFMDQINAGTAHVLDAEGTDMGDIASFVSSATGTPITGTAGAAAAGTAAGGGKVLFDATPYLRSLIKPTSVSGQVYVDPNSLWEAPPSQILPGDRPTGQAG